MYKNPLYFSLLSCEQCCFNPCFNGSMYKNLFQFDRWKLVPLCFNPCFNGSMYKNSLIVWLTPSLMWVSILVLMDLCIKTREVARKTPATLCFNPCFNGSMYKNLLWREYRVCLHQRFNPCFNGSMYKNLPILSTLLWFSHLFQSLF